MSVRPYLLGPDEGEAFAFLGSLVTIKAASRRVSVVEFLNPPGFAPPLHRHKEEDELFHLLSGSADFHCDGEILHAAPGDFVLLPAGLPHTFLVGPGEPLHVLQITTPGGFEDFVATAGHPASSRALPEPEPVDPAALGHAAALHGIEILGPPPGL
ncbi:cupin domain-containing protein [Actinomadura macrotermitis]|uniref:Cupin type-2 domain-containing protein n=1 Tax=Actinomadura macrotermitis TaxID=2585200 RepID=A0A7K0BRI0_9ACTN|nr:cupin domain-containing protein [Actinomadura macrotermitis]MQY03324.1 hypothetical protein [Actinomadura macrotermitis]